MLSLRTRWFVAWVCLTCIPFFPVYWPQIGKLLSDTPDAYLCFVPVLAMVWMIRGMRQATTDYPNDSELNFILGVTLSFIVLFLAVWGLTHYPLTFYGEGIVLALWPIWGLTVSWFIFGVGSSRWVWRPLLLFLYLDVPSLYNVISIRVSSGLSALTNSFIANLTNFVHWIHWQGTSGSVLYRSDWIPVSITTACTGADSVMAVLIVLIFLLSTRTGSLLRKASWVLIGLVLAVFMNCIRVLTLVSVLHVWGSSQVFDDVHALLGVFLFVIMAAVLVKAGEFLGLEPQGSKAYSDLRTPGKISVSLTTVVSLMLLVTVFLGRYDNQANVWTTFSTRTDIANGAYPDIAGYYMVSLGSFDDSSILGEGTHSYSMAYSNQAGQYYRVESWNAPSGWRLEDYSVNDCLTFHGDEILSGARLNLPHAIQAHFYLVALPPMQRGAGEDIYGVVTIMFQDNDRVVNGTPTYERVEISSPMRRNVPKSELRYTSIDRADLIEFSSTLINNLLV